MSNGNQKLKGGLCELYINNNYGYSCLKRTNKRNRKIKTFKKNKEYEIKTE